MGLTQSREPSPQGGRHRWLFWPKLVEKRVRWRQKQLLGSNSVLSGHVGSISPSSSSLLPKPFSEYAPLHRGAIQAMATEIERKFLVISDEWRNHVTESIPIAQGYIQAREDRAVRVRLKGNRALLTIKVARSSIERLEFEYEIPLADAKQLIAQPVQRARSRRRGTLYRLPTDCSGKLMNSWVTMRPWWLRKLNYPVLSKHSRVRNGSGPR